MPSINDIATIADALEKAPVIVVQDRCVAVRNRNATCRACMRICPFGAVKVAANELTLDPAACVGCGACAAACPTQALIARDPSDSALSDACKSLAGKEGECAIACARSASKRLADPDRYVEVSCLARVDEALLIEAAAAGARDIVLVDGTCSTCKHGPCTQDVDDIIAQANGLLECQGAPALVRRSSAFPEQLIVEDAAGRFGSTRRGFLSDAASAARETAVTAARTTVANELGLKEGEVSIGERLRVGAGGSLPRIQVPRHMRLLDAFDALGEPCAERLETRRLGVVSIDSLRCNSCGMCAVFCPTGALSRNPDDKPSDPLRVLEFTAADCINCRMCCDVCWKGAITLEPGVSVQQLFDFEPVVFELQPPMKRSPFGG